jgi:hypothetical protein
LWAETKRATLIQSGPVVCLRNTSFRQRNFPRTAGARGVRVIERESLAIQSARKLEGGIEKVEKTLQVGYYFYAIVLENLIGWFGFVVEVHFVRQAGTAAGGYTYPHEEVFGDVAFRADFLNFGFGAFSYENHG